MKPLICSTFIMIALTQFFYGEEVPEVRTSFPSRAKADAVYQIPGRTAAVESATLFTRATGIVKERRFEIGDVVKTGEVLAVVDAPEIDRSVDAARASVEQNKARLENAKNLADRSTKLLQAHAISQEESDQRRNTLAEMEAAVKVSQAELARLEEQQKFATMRAPFEGVISARNFERGDHVRGDDAAVTGWLYRLERLDTLRFIVSATPDLATRLNQDVEAIITFGEFPARQFKAKVAHSSRVFDTTTGTMRVELLLDNKDLLIPAGLTGMVQFKLSPSEGTFLIPVNALVVREGKSRVAVLGEGKVRFIEVRQGRNFGRDVEVTASGLSESTPVILNPNAMLREGDQVAAVPLTASK